MRFLVVAVRDTLPHPCMLAVARHGLAAVVRVTPSH
jgi:hypothetical protein